MSILIDQVEGIVQQDAEPQPEAPAATGGPPQHPDELLDELQRRARRLVHRLHAD